MRERTVWNDGPGGAGTPLWMQLTCSVPRGWDPQEKECLSFTHFPPSSHGLPRGYGVKNLCAMQKTQEMQVRSLSCREDPLQEGNGNPLQYSRLENTMDTGSWWATVCGVATSWT